MSISRDYGNENYTLDIIKYLSAVLIAVSHCLPITGNADVNNYFGQWFFRFCVPLFFISSGYFFELAADKKKRKYILRIAFLYVICNIIYLPITVDRAQSTGTSLAGGIILGSMTHLWYLSALLFALVILYLLGKIPKSGIICAVLLPVLLFAGIYFDEYCGVFPNDFLLSFKDKLDIIGGARHALFFALPMLFIGKFLARSRRIMNIPAYISFFLTVIAFTLSFAECRFLFSKLGIYITCDLTLFNYLPAVFLFIFSFGIKDIFAPCINSLSLRKQADMIYFSHFWFVEIYNRAAQYDYRYRTAAVIAASCVFSFAAVKVMNIFRKKN